MEDLAVKVIVATHLEYKMPKDNMYIPLHVGSELSKEDFGYQKDNTGENISKLNPGFCELTGLYWAWKNLDAGYIGMVHYRRQFSLKNKKGIENALSYEELKPYLGKVKVFVPKKRKYYIETLYSHYAHTHYIEQLDEAKKITEEKYPEYLESFNRVVNKRSGYMFNMMIMQKDLLNEYCKWVFDILFELDKRIDIPELSAFESRFYGRISEIIFNAWLDKKITEGTLSKEEVMEIPYIHTEKVNWWKKGKAFLAAKFFGKKYEASF